MKDASVPSNNVTEAENVEPYEAVAPKSLDGWGIDELVGRAQAEGLQVAGEGGLLQQVAKRLLESLSRGESPDHLAYDRHDRAGKNGGNSRNGTRAKTVLTASAGTPGTSGLTPPAQLPLCDARGAQRRGRGDSSYVFRALSGVGARPITRKPCTADRNGYTAQRSLYQRLPDSRRQRPGTHPPAPRPRHDSQPVPDCPQRGAYDQDRGVLGTVDAVLEGVPWCVAHPLDPLIRPPPPPTQVPGAPGSRPPPVRGGVRTGTPRWVIRR